MSKQYLNGIPYGVSMPYRELTQAEYDALPDSKNNDGIMYFIKNAGVAGGIKMFALADIYDTNEREIGVWKDGKPIYQKGFECNFTSTTSWYNTQISASDMETMISGTAIDSDSQCYPIIVGTYTSPSRTIGIRLPQADSGGSNIKFMSIQYTKISDVAGSGTLAQGGVPSHHYSTEEQVIGTWIDGKPLYEKTFAKNNVEVYNGYSFAHGISNLELVTDLKVFMKNSAQYQDNLFIPINSDMSVNIGFRANETYIKATGSNNFGPLSDRYWYFIIQYTKTTD